MACNGGRCRGWKNLYFSGCGGLFFDGSSFAKIWCCRPVKKGRRYETMAARRMWLHLEPGALQDRG
jgi:hypothetical protein